MKKYKVDWWDEVFVSVREVEISRESDHNIWVIIKATGKEIRYHKESSDKKYFDTLEEAKTFALAILERRKKAAEHIIRRVKAMLFEINKM